MDFVGTWLLYEMDLWDEDYQYGGSSYIEMTQTIKEIFNSI